MHYEIVAVDLTSQTKQSVWSINIEPIVLIRLFRYIWYCSIVHLLVLVDGYGTVTLIENDFIYISTLIQS